MHRDVLVVGLLHVAACAPRSDVVPALDEPARDGIRQRLVSLDRLSMVAQVLVDDPPRPHLLVSQPGVQLATHFGHVFESADAELLHQVAPADPGKAVALLLELRDQPFDALPAGSETARVLLRQERQRTLRECGGRERRLHAVVVTCRDGVELVVVALGASQREPHEGRRCRMRHVVEPLLPGNGRYRHAGVLPRAHPQEARRQDGLRVAREQLIASNLLEHEAVVGLVVVERADDVIAITPGIGPLVVVREACRICVARHVKPVATPALAVTRRSQEAIHDFRERSFVASGILDERFDLLGSGRQAGQVDRRATDQRRSVRARRRSQPGFGQLDAEERIHVARRVDLADRTKRPQVRFLELVPIEVRDSRASGKGRPGVDPLADCRDRFIGQPSCGRHPEFTRMIERAVQQACACISRNDRRSSRPALHQSVSAPQVELAEELAFTMTTQAMLLEDWLDRVPEHSFGGLGRL